MSINLARRISFPLTQSSAQKQHDLFGFPSIPEIRRKFNKRNY